MTLFKSLRDLLATYLLLEDNSTGLIVGKQEMEGNPQQQHTIVIYYSKCGTFYHESTIENDPSNRELIIENQELFKALLINNMDCEINKKPSVIVEESVYTTIRFRDLIDQITAHRKEIQKVQKNYLIK